MLRSDKVSRGLILRWSRRQQEHHPAEILATRKAAIILAHCDESVRAAARDLDALCTLDGFVDSRLSIDRSDQKGNQRDTQPGQAFYNRYFFAWRFSA